MSRHFPANLPGWCWAQILQSALVGLSSSLHTEVCNAVRISDGVLHRTKSRETPSISAAVNATTIASGKAQPIIAQCASNAQAHHYSFHTHLATLMCFQKEPYSVFLGASAILSILVEGAMALPVTHGGGVPFAVENYSNSCQV